LFGGGCPTERVRLIADRSDRCEWKLKFAARQSKPSICLKDARDALTSQLQPVNPNAPRTPMDAVPPPDDIGFGMAGPPSDVLKIKTTEDFMKKYEPLVMIVEMVGRTHVKHSTLEADLALMEGRFKGAGYEVQTLTAHAEHWVPQRRGRFYVVCVHNQKYDSIHGGSNALPVVMHDLSSLWQDRFCNISALRLCFSYEGLSAPE
jgi:hypothetical protein